MASTQFGNFYNFCRDSTLPVCNLFPRFRYENSIGLRDGCRLSGLSVSGGKHIGNLGSIIIASIAIIITIVLIVLAERKKAAVGRREMQIFFFTYILLQICEIFTVGLFPLDTAVRTAFTGAHLGLVIASTWILLLNAIIGYQLWEDGTPLSVGMTIATAAALGLGTAYIALDTGFRWTGHFDPSLGGQNQNVGLYVLYQLVPLIFLIAYFSLETVLVLLILKEIKPVVYLVSATLLFTIGQLFNYVISIHICHASSGRINGALFETFFTLAAVVLLWIFWSSITEDDWPCPDNPTP